MSNGGFVPELILNGPTSEGLIRNNWRILGHKRIIEFRRGISWIESLNFLECRYLLSRVLRFIFELVDKCWLLHNEVCHEFHVIAE